MTKDDLPDANDPTAIFEFAMKFNGYEHFGSFEACEKAATSRSRDSLEAVQNELFFECRASRHRGDQGYVGLYLELQPHFQILIEA